MAVFFSGGDAMWKARGAGCAGRVYARHRVVDRVSMMRRGRSGSPPSLSSATILRLCIMRGRPGEMPRAEVAIVNKLGLHARASARLAQLAGGFAAEVWLERNGRRVNARSIMGLMMLAAAQGASIVIETAGEEADVALARVAELVANRFGEDE
jgi:phosphocarrier protein